MNVRALSLFPSKEFGFPKLITFAFVVVDMLVGGTGGGFLGGLGAVGVTGAVGAAVRGAGVRRCVGSGVIGARACSGRAGVLGVSTSDSSGSGVWVAGSGARIRGGRKADGGNLLRRSGTAWFSRFLASAALF